MWGVNVVTNISSIPCNVMSWFHLQYMKSLTLGTILYVHTHTHTHRARETEIYQSAEHDDCLCVVKSKRLQPTTLKTIAQMWYLINVIHYD